MRGMQKFTGNQKKEVVVSKENRTLINVEINDDSVLSPKYMGNELLKKPNM